MGGIHLVFLCSWKGLGQSNQTMQVIQLRHQVMEEERLFLPFPPTVSSAPENQLQRVGKPS